MYVASAVMMGTWFRISENCGSLLSSTRLSQVISVIHLLGFAGQALRSRAAPPASHTHTHRNSNHELAVVMVEVYQSCSNSHSPLMRV